MSDINVAPASIDERDKIVPEYMFRIKFYFSFNRPFFLFALLSDSPYKMLMIDNVNFSWRIMLRFFMFVKFAFVCVSVQSFFCSVVFLS